MVITANFKYNTKRAEIKAGLNITVSAFSKLEEDILLLESCHDIQEKKMELSTMSLGCKKSKMFSMSDTFELENNSAAFIVRSSATAVLGEVRKISNKAMVTHQN